MEENNENKTTDEEVDVTQTNENTEKCHNKSSVNQILNYSDFDKKHQVCDESSTKEIVQSSVENLLRSDYSGSELDISTSSSTELLHSEFKQNTKTELPITVSNEFGDNLTLTEVITNNSANFSEIGTLDHYKNMTQHSNENKEIPDFIQRIIEFLDSSRFNKTLNDVHCPESSLWNNISETKNTSTLENITCEKVNSEQFVGNFTFSDHSLTKTNIGTNLKTFDKNAQDNNLKYTTKISAEEMDSSTSINEKNNSSVLKLKTSETINELFEEINNDNFEKNFDFMNRDKYSSENTYLNNFPSNENLFNSKFVNLKSINESENTNFEITNKEEKSFFSIQESSNKTCSKNNFEFYNDVVVKSSLKRTSNQDTKNEHSLCKKARRGITFDSVSVYYFPRTQGFTCIPSQGGSTLGMSWHHSHIRKFSLGEYAAEQRRAHRQFCSQQFSSSRNWNEVSNLSSEDSDSDEIISDSEMDYENYNFLQPIPTRERRAMLRAAGISKIDSEEKDECRSIRLSREFCGCTCQMYCDPERCVCAQAGIKCQVDRMNFPCSCSREGCANENGRIEFNPVRVRTHYIRTLMRLEIEKKKEEEEQRNRMILNNLESSSQLSYSASSLSSGISGGTLVNFSYHNNLPSYYSQPSTYTISSSSNLDNACFNINYIAANEQFVLPPTTEIVSYNQPISTNFKLSIENSSPDGEYRSPSPISEKCLHSAEYSNINKEEENHDFIIRDLTNNSKNKDANIAFNSDSYIQMTEENFENIESTSQEENLDTSIEVSEETEKDESDLENFGDIIKKTMVESVIA